MPAGGCGDEAGNAEGLTGAAPAAGAAFTAGAGAYLISVFFGRQEPIANTTIAATDSDTIFLIAIYFDRLKISPRSIFQ